MTKRWTIGFMGFLKSPFILLGPMSRRRNEEPQAVNCSRSSANMRQHASSLGAWLAPILDVEPLHAREFIDVVGHDRRVKVKSMRGDLHVVGPDGAPTCLELASHESEA